MDWEGMWWQLRITLADRFFIHSIHVCIHAVPVLYYCTNFKHGGNRDSVPFENHFNIIYFCLHCCIFSKKKKKRKMFLKLYKVSQKKATVSTDVSAQAIRSKSAEGVLSSCFAGSFLPHHLNPENSVVQLICPWGVEREKNKR